MKLLILLTIFVSLSCARKQEKDPAKKTKPGVPTDPDTGSGGGGGIDFDPNDGTPLGEQGGSGSIMPPGGGGTDFGQPPIGGGGGNIDPGVPPIGGGNDSDPSPSPPGGGGSDPGPPSPGGNNGGNDGSKPSPPPPGGGGHDRDSQRSEKGNKLILASLVKNRADQYQVKLEEVVNQSIRTIPRDFSIKYKIQGNEKGVGLHLELKKTSNTYCKAVGELPGPNAKVYLTCAP